MIWGRQKSGDGARDFYNRLVAGHLDALYRTAYRLTGEVPEAEDLTQEVFLQAWKSIRQLQEREEARPWLFRVLRNAWIDRLRKRARRPELVGMEEPPELATPPSVPVFTTKEDREAWNEHFDGEVLEVIEELPEGMRLVLLYHTFGELSYQEIAEALGCPVGTVMSRLHRGRSHLQKRLADYAERQGLLRKE